MGFCVTRRGEVFVRMVNVSYVIYVLWKMCIFVTLWRVCR